MYLSVYPNHFIQVSAVSEEVRQPNSDKMWGPLRTAQLTCWGWRQLELRPEDRRLCRNRCQRPGSLEEAACVAGCAGRSQLLCPPPVPARLRSLLRSPPPPAPAPAPAPCARPPARPPAGALTLGSSLGVLPRASPRSGRAGGGWACWLCRESLGVSARPAATDN